MSEPVRESTSWDAGALGCGELVLELRNRMRAMPGGVLKVIATDPGATRGHTGVVPAHGKRAAPAGCRKLLLLDQSEEIAIK